MTTRAWRARALIAPVEALVCLPGRRFLSERASSILGQVATSIHSPAPVLRGRAVECATIDELLEAVRKGQSGVLVIRGEAGIGKSALLDFAAARASETRVLRAAGVESEMELAYAALHQLCLPLLEAVVRLPAPQRDALGTAFGSSAGPTPDRFLVGLAVLTLFSDAAEAEPLILLVDDAHWLDRSSAQALSFVARRLQAESVAILFAAREEGAVDELAGLLELRLGGLSEADARELLEAPGVGPLDERVRDRIIAEARGNPLALLELPHALSPAGLAGGFAVPGTLELAGRIEAVFRGRVKQLPEETRRLLLVGAAEPIGDPALLGRAAAALGIRIEAAAPAEEADLIAVGARVTFRHPLLRSALYDAASPEQRRAAHRALAQATDPELDPDRRAWHRAHAALAPDEDVAGELELSAERAQGRGGLAAAAAFIERAAELTPEPGRRARRALAAARAKRLAGLPDAASALLARAMQGPLEKLDDAMSQRLRGQIALDLSRGGEAASLLLDAARRLETLDVRLARETYLEALWAASNAGRFGSGVLAAAQAARAAPPAPEPQGATDLLLDGLAVLFTDGYASGAPLLKQALARFRDEPSRDEHDVRGTRMAARVAAELLDDETWNVLATRHVEIAREAGLFAALPVTLGYLAALRIHEGNLDAAAILLNEFDAIRAATGSPTSVTRLLLAAYRGDAGEAASLRSVLEPEARARGDGVILTVCEYTSALLHNGLGHYETALAAAQQACAMDDLSVSSWSLPELVEAAARSGKPEVAAAAFDRLFERTTAAETDFALGIEARSRALTSAGTAAESAYREAVAVLGRTRMRLSLARAQLVYGEWLRRENRRVEAREQLRHAYETLSGMRANAFAERARRELLATGENPRKRTDETRGQLTAQEEQIARLAADGLTNPEIGAQLFLSPRTVEWHLRKVFTKLGINSRRDLWVAGALPEAERPRPRV
jgi:DNA-binding CsgD family transcriptional regulator